jgi:hypothetical protein
MIGGAAGGAVTLKAAEALLTEPASLLTTTSYEPASSIVALVMV